MKTYKEIAGIVALWVLIVFGLGAVFAGVEMLLWNQVMPKLFGLKQITYWQALCVSWLSAMLIKGMPSSSSTKSEEHLERIRDLSARQETLLARIIELEDFQVKTLDDMKGSLQDIGNTLESQR